MNNGSTSFVERLRSKFLSNPVNMWVVLPDGSLAVVKSVSEANDGKLYKVAGIHPNGRFRALAGISCWYSADELRLRYWSASVSEVAA